MSENPILSAIEKQDWLQPIQDKAPDLLRDAFKSAGPAGQTVKNALHGVWLGHALHPAVTDVPVGSWTVTTTLDVLEVCGHSQYRAGADAAVMIGLLGALPAALSGITDWGETHSNPQRAGIVHGVLNMGATVLYAGSYAARKAEKRSVGRWLGFLGYGLLMAGAYLGGELSYSQKIGVNHAPDPEGELPEDYTEAIAEQDLVDGKPAKATVGGTKIFLLKRGPQIFAMADQCSHLSGPLSEGKVEGDSIICPWHASRFCLKDGRVEDGPATHSQPVLDVLVKDGKVLVRAQQR